MPILKLDDGKRYVQTAAILTFIGRVWDLEPKDPEINYEGQMAMEYYWHDFFEKLVVPALFDDSPDREKIIK